MGPPVDRSVIMLTVQPHLVLHLIARHHLKSSKPSKNIIKEVMSSSKIAYSCKKKKGTALFKMASVKKVMKSKGASRNGCVGIG